MTSLAVGFRELSSTVDFWDFSSDRIFPVGNWFEVNGVNTESITTEMVDLESIRFGPNEMLIGPSMDSGVASSTSVHNWIGLVFAYTTIDGSTSPYPALIIWSSGKVMVEPFLWCANEVPPSAAKSASKVLTMMLAAVGFTSRFSVARLNFTRHKVTLVGVGGVSN